MRELLLAGLPESRHWTPISADLERLFTAWFNRGFLELRRIDWQASAVVLEKLIRYEAVHQIKGWEDLRRRLAADRRCYAFFHPALPDEPIIFIEVALTKGMSAAVQPLLDPRSPVLDAASADTAVFYSITNCQEGLRGVPFGSFLIKQVAADLSAAFPRLRRFATLSPVPGFRRWLERTIPVDSEFSKWIALLGDASWLDQADVRSGMEHALIPLCAYYLLNAKHGREPLDAVARFHLRNGASLERINWLGDTSTVGMDRSCGLMVNYVYRLKEIEHNHELYTGKDRVVCSRAIDSAARKIAGR
jgi:malonyl-CoA decarboxylase